MKVSRHDHFHRSPAAPAPDAAPAACQAGQYDVVVGSATQDHYDPAAIPKGPVDKNAGRETGTRLIDAFPNLEPLRGVLRVEDAGDLAVRKNLEDLAKFPKPLLARLRKAGLTDVHLAARPVPYLDSNEYLQGVRPRGWPEGRTWDDVAGVYNPNAKSVAIGKGEAGSASLALHETSHAIGALLGYDMDPKVIAHHERLLKQTIPHPCRPAEQVPKLPPYLRLVSAEGDYTAGRQEFLAESIATYLTEGKQAAIKAFDREWVAFIETEILGKKA